MKKLFQFFLSFACLLAATYPAAATVSPITHQQLEPSFVEEILGYFQEGKVIDPKWLEYSVNPNIRLYQEAEIIVTILEEDTAYNNNFGYFLYLDLNEDGDISPDEILTKEIIFENASLEGRGGTLHRGDTVSLGKFPSGTHLGFFLIANGARGGTTTYYTIDSLNPNTERHLAMQATPDRETVALGIEDLPMAISDKDYNDIVFAFYSNPRSALKEAIVVGNVPPTPEPTPAPPGIDTPAIASLQEPSLPPASPEEPMVAVVAPAAPVLFEGSGMGCQLGGAGAASPLDLLGLLLLSGLCLWRGR